MKGMRLKAMLAAPGALFATYLWLLLYVILSVPLWVTFIASGAVLVASMFAAATVRGTAAPADARHGDIVVGDDGVVMNPLVNVASLRLRFALTLGLMFLGGWLVVETFAFAASSQRWISFACGVAAAVFGAASYVGFRRRSRERKQSVVIPSRGYRFTLWQALGAAVMALGAWQIVETLVFSTGATRWLTFENAIALLALAVTGLVVHEFSTERVVHVLEVAGWRHAGDRPAARAAA